MKKKKSPSKSKKKSNQTSLDFKTAFKYPFNRAKGMWNILWILLPIFGWLALGGYSVRIAQEFIKGKFRKLPTLKFGSDMKLGFFMFLKTLPFIFAYMIITAPLYAVDFWIGATVRILLETFVIPILFINFFKKETVGSLFELRVVKYVFNNLGD